MPGEEGTQAGGEEGKEVVSKAELEAASAENQKLKQDLEDLRMEVMSPEYLEWLNAREQGGKKEPVPVKEEVISEDVLEKMSKKDILELATKQAEAKVQARLDAIESKVSKSEEQARAVEVARFARTHDDFEKYRRTMYGLSLDKVNKDMSLEELYNKAKDHIKSVGLELIEGEKAKSKRLTGEKPGGSSSSLKQGEKLSFADASKAAVSEVEATLGPLPSE